MTTDPVRDSFDSDDALARRAFAVLPAAEVPSGLAERIERRIQREREQARWSHRGRLALAAAAVALIAIAAPLATPKSASPMLSDAAAQQVFDQWDADYLASRQDALLAAAPVSAADDLMAMDASAPPDPLAAIVGF